MKLSVIVPGYNTSDNTWERCIASILKAIPNESEIICVDDGSSHSPNVYFSDARVKWILLKNNEGQSIARNKALECAKGDWIAFVDSDDEVVPHTYNEAIESLTSTGADIALFGVRTIWLKDGLMNESSPNASLTAESLDQEKLAGLTEQRLFDVVWNKIYRRSFIETHKIRFAVGICPGEDTMFVLDCVLNRAKWIFIDNIGYVYYRTNGTSLSRYKGNLGATLRFWKAKWDFYLSTVGKGYSGWWPTRNYSKEWVSRLEWDNIWLPGCQATMSERWKYLCLINNSGFLRNLAAFARKWVWFILRKYCYIRPIRRWKIKRMYPNAKEWRE